jgi:Mlc titration factor MtfA (ptsG expression regulator)
VILHEFAHKLDMLQGGADGVPPLTGGDAAYDAWAEVMSQEFRTLRRTAWQGQETIMDSYGAENEAEFFAVATETFFEKPYPLYIEHTELYELLTSYYKQDTASRWYKWQSHNKSASDTENSRVSDMSFPLHPAEYIAED